MMDSRTASDALLPGRGHSPGYGINESSDSYKIQASKTIRFNHKDRWHVVAFCALTACVISAVTGISLGYSSIIINELNGYPRNHPWYINQSSLHASLIGALMPAGAIFGGLFAWPVSDYLGRQASLMIGGVPSLIGWILISLSVIFTRSMYFILMILIGRFFTGFSSGWSVYCVSVYIAEIASAKRKGLFGNCNQLFITIGILICYILGIKFGKVRVSFYIVALVAAGIVAIFEFLMLFTYETPRWLIGKNKEFLGIKVLKILRGPDGHIMKEIDRIKAALRKSYTVVEQFKEFRLRSVYQPFMLSLMLMFFQQFSGINAAIFFSSKVFSDAGIADNKAEVVTALAVGVTQIIATFISVLLVDRLGRRVLLVTSSVGMGTSSAMLAIYFYLKSKPDFNSHLSIIAIVAVVIFIAAFSLGWGPIPWSSMSEILPNRVRGLTASIATIVNWSFATIITLFFEDYADKITPKFAWASFAIVMAVSIVCVILFLPETKGHSLEEIQEGFERGKIFAVDCGRRHHVEIEGRTSSINTVPTENGFQ